MKKNKYNFPQRATNSNNPIYNQYVENLYSEDYYGGPTCGDAEKRSQRKGYKQNGKIDEYHQPKDGETYTQDPYTVAQNFLDRSQFPLG